MALNIYTEQSAVRDGVTADEVKGVLLGMASGQETLLGYFKRFICNFEKRVGVNRTIGSLRAYRNAYNHIERFLQVQYKLSDIPFSALDRSFIDKYDLHLRTERNLAPGTIINLTVQLKTIVGEAIADGIITASPFLGYEPVRPKAVQKYLTAEELHRIMTTPLHRQTLYHVRDLFLFSCFTSGEDDFPENRLRHDLALPVRGRATFACGMESAVSHLFFHLVRASFFASPVQL